MKICKHCGHEIVEQSGNTIKIKGKEIELPYDLEVEIEVTQKGAKLKDIKIPKGWSLLNCDEVVKLANSKYAKQLKMDGSFYDEDFFIERLSEFHMKKGRIAWFGSGSRRVDLDWDPALSGDGLGIRFCRRIKKK
jgi:hypothetical protein